MLQLDLAEEAARADSLGEIESAGLAADMHEADDVAEATRRSLLPDGGAGAPPTTRAGPSGSLSAGNAAAAAASSGGAAAEAEAPTPLGRDLEREHARARAKSGP